MNYHIIPTKPHDASLMIRTTTATSIVPIISNSFFNSIPNIKAQFNITYLAKQHNMSDEDIIHMMKINDIYGFLSEVVCPDFAAKHGMGEVFNNSFFTRVEVLSTCDLLQPLQSATANHKILYIGNDYSSFSHVVAYMLPRHPPAITHILPIRLRDPTWFEYVNNIPTSKQSALIYVDACANTPTYPPTYLMFLLKTLAIILACQEKNGSVVIKIGSLYFKPILDVLFILSGKYTNMHIMRPFVSEDTDTRFVVFTKLLSRPIALDNLITSANAAKSTIPPEIIYSVTDYEMSHYFANKIEECNLLIGQKNVEQYDSLMMMIKNSSKESRCESAKKTSIMRCAYWCEKNNIPTNPTLTDR